MREQGSCKSRCRAVRRPHRDRLCDAAVRDRQPRRPPGRDDAAPAGRGPTSMRSASPSTARPGPSSARSDSPRSAASNSSPSISARCWSSCSAFRCSGASSGWPRPRRSPRSPTSSARATARAFPSRSIATLIAIVGAVPYIALQLKAISGSVSLMVEHYTGAPLILRSVRQRHLAGRRHAACAVCRAVRHAPCRRHRASGRAGAGGRGRIGRQAGGLPGGRPHGRPSSCSTARPASSTRSPPTPQVQQALQLPHLARHLAGADGAQRLRHHHAAAPVLRDDRREPQRERACAPRPGCFRSISWRSTCSSCRSPSPARRWSATAPARPLRAVAAAAQRPRRARHGRLHRRPVGGDRHGHRRQRRAVDHDLQRSGHPAVRARPAEDADQRRTKTGRA